jgi:hypothetical protein
VNQALRSLQSHGYIRADGGRFEILDRKRLERLAERLKFSVVSAR